MKTSSTPSRAPRRLTPWLLSALASAALIVAGCGGGGDAGATGDAAGSGLAVGAIDGFGSIIVQGVRYDDSSAQVVDEDGSASSSSVLKLGMVVEVQHQGITPDDRGGTDRSRAERIALGGAIVGPADSIDATAGTLQVMGQSVTVGTDTVFGEGITGGLAGLSNGSVLRVHGIYDASTRRTAATRIDLGPNALVYRARGTVSELDLNAKTLTLGGLNIDLSQVLVALPADLADGLVVRVVLSTTPQADGQWTARSVRSGATRFDGHHAAELEGFITDFTSATSFKLNGLAVDASAASFPNGQDGLKLGARVEVEGRVVNGVLVAAKVELKLPRALRGLELHGTVSGLDTTGKTFQLRGLTVAYGEVVVWRDGDASALADGAKVEVKGQLSADRQTITATRIEFEN